MPQNYPVPVQFNIVGLNDLREANRYLGTMAKPSGTVARATKSTARFGNTAQNVGYQVQDLIVQIQGGTDASRALSQQLPQMVVGFGAWGAAIGVVAAALPVLITSLMGTTDEVEDFSEALDNAGANLDVLSARDSKLDLEEMAKQWQAAGDGADEFYQSTLKIQRLNLQEEIRQVNNALSEQTEEYTQLTGLQGFLTRFGAGGLAQQVGGVSPGADIAGLKEANKIIEASKEQFRLNDENAKKFRDLTTQYQQGEITAAEYAEAVYDQAAGAEEANNAFREYAETLQRIVGLQKELKQLSEPASVAALVGPPENLAGAGDLSSSEQEMLQRFRDDRAMDTTEGIAKNAEEASVAVTAFETSFSAAVQGIAMGTQSIDDAFKSMVQSIVAQLARMAAEWLATQAIIGLFGGPVGGAGLLGGLLGSEKGNAFQGGRQLTAFAKGGVVSSPTIFPMARGAGLMGEAGPEAIMPLSRNNRGELGVKTAGGGSMVNVNITSPDAGGVARLINENRGIFVNVMRQALNEQGRTL